MCAHTHPYKTQTYRQTDIQTDRQTDRHTHTHTHTQSEREQGVELLVLSIM